MVLDSTAGTPGSSTAVTITPYAGNRASGTTMQFNGSVNNVWDGNTANWTEVSATAPRLAIGPESATRYKSGPRHSPVPR